MTNYFGLKEKLVFDIKNSDWQNGLAGNVAEPGEMI